MLNIHNGSCNCGKVSFTVKGELRDILGCHCSQCRKQTGFYYAATEAKCSDLTIKGEENITWYEASPTAKRGFCATCGSALFWQANDLDTVSILAGAFDTPTGMKFKAHIFCADKGDFYEITDEYPQYAKDNGNIFEEN
ncbi:MAG: GFA family protein [Lentilitoribacter sp.]